MSRAAKTLRVASVNVNGIRAAYRKDMATWLAGRDVDILCLQEVRAPDKIVRELLNEDDWNILHAEAAAKGRAGVLVATRKHSNANGELLKTSLSLPAPRSAKTISRTLAAGLRRTTPCPPAKP